MFRYSTLFSISKNFIILVFLIIHRQPRCNLRHVRFSMHCPIHAVYSHWKIQRLLYSPNLFVFIWRKNLCRVSNSYPSDGNRCALQNSCPRVHNPVHSHLTPSFQVRSVENSGSRGDKDGFFGCAAHDVGIWPNQVVPADRCRMLCRTSYDGVLENDAVIAYIYFPAFSDDRCSKQYARSLSYSNVSTYRCSGCYVS